MNPPAPSSVYSSELAYSGPGPSSEGGVISQSKLILCVDDETVGLQVRRLLLERAGYRVLTALDGPTGIDLFEREPVEAVVLDYSMPGMTGGEVAARLRSIKPQVPILMLSAYTSLPPEVDGLIDMAMTKGEGAPAFLKRLGYLVSTHVHLAD